MSVLRLFVSVPVCGFRVAQARSYWETYLFPPPATVYGMLLSLIGEQNRLRYEGAEIAIALLGSEPQPIPSVVLRTMWRFKGSDKPGHTEKGNTTPDYQELLTHIRLSVWVRQVQQEQRMSLAKQLEFALKNPATISRYGGLSLGESTHLVDEVRCWREGDADKFDTSWLLVSQDTCDERGVSSLTLPVWPDHVGSKGTRWGQFILRERPTKECKDLTEDAWIAIKHPINSARQSV